MVNIFIESSLKNVIEFRKESCNVGKLHSDHSMHADLKYNYSIFFNVEKKIYFEQEMSNCDRKK